MDRNEASMLVKGVFTDLNQQNRLNWFYGNS
jgi:hypothetical protein